LVIQAQSHPLVGAPVAASGPIVVSLCDESGVMVQPWLEAGYECWIVDVRHPEGVTRQGRLVKVGADVRTWLPPRRQYAAAFGFPPCTDLANSGNRWKRGKGLQKLSDALALVEACRRILDWTDAPWALENPVGSISTYWRKPDYTFHPWHYGDNEQKLTCLWTGNGFVMPPYEVTKKPADVKQSCWLMPPSEDRGNLRSVTPIGFARAVFQANSPQAVEFQLNGQVQEAS
jgi:hypothetical protein